MLKQLEHLEKNINLAEDDSFQVGILYNALELVKLELDREITSWSLKGFNHRFKKYLITKMTEYDDQIDALVLIDPNYNSDDIDIINAKLRKYMIVHNQFENLESKLLELLKG